jgi:hypothetical protein
METETGGAGVELTIKVRFADAELPLWFHARTMTLCGPADMEMLGLIVAVAPAL